MMKAMVLSSGGIDSTTCLGLAVERFGRENVVALSISYGQKHEKEIQASDAVARHYGVEHICLDLAKIFEHSNCSLLQHSTQEIPAEAYAEQLKKTDGQPVSTYVPFRNGLFLSSAASIALSYCSSGFNKAISEAIYIGSGNQLKVEAPFVNMTKAEVVKIGLERKVPYELTWSCYEGKEEPCGVCGTCLDRAEAFRLNGVKDPAI